MLHEHSLTTNTLSTTTTLKNTKTTITTATSTTTRTSTKTIEPKRRLQNPTNLGILRRGPEGPGTQPFLTGFCKTPRARARRTTTNTRTTPKSPRKK